MLEVSIQALSVGAMARHRLGDAEGARKALQEVDRRVQVLVRTGELGRSYDNTWDSIARGIALRWEAERLILGKASPALDPAAIAANRAKYQSVTFSLNAADQMGRQSQWVPAVEYYSKAVQDPAFDWTISEIKQDLICQKMAAVFLMTEDQTRYCELVKVLLDRKVENLTPMMQERYAQIFVSKPEVLPAELKSRALAYARRVCELPGAETNPWLCMLQGVTDYREGQYEKAVVALNQAFFAPSDSDGAARAMTYKAMACKKLGRTKEAVEATQEANALFAKQTSRSDWTNTAFYQLAMKELLGFLANGNESLKTP